MTLVECSRVVLALGLPWAAGTVWAAAAFRPGTSGRWPLALGYGFPLGMLLVVLIMLGLDGMGLAQSFPATAMLVAAGGLAAFWFLARAGRDGTSAVSARQLFVEAWQSSLPAFRWIAVVVVVLILSKLVIILQELSLRPLFPWDAWDFHAVEARIWAEHGALVEMTRSWWAGQTGQTDAVYVQFSFTLHPPGLSLIQLWVIQALGRYDDALMNLPWFCLAVSLCLATYGLIRLAGGARLTALVAMYLLLSMPMVFSHLALGGYADIWMATYMLLVVGALYAWLEERRAGTAILFVAALAGMLMMKQSGLFWAPIVLAGLFFGLVRARWAVGAAVIVVAGLLAVQFMTELDLVGRFTSRRLAEAPQEFSEVGAHLARNLFAYANWHLLWYVLPLAVICAFWDSRMRRSSLIGVGSVIVLGLAALLFSFFFTRAGAWVVSGTTVNRVLLHLVPVIVFWTALVVEGMVRMGSSHSGVIGMQPRPETA